MPKKKTKVSSAKVSKELDATIVSDDFFIVGIGASAGGLSAFESFFSAMPTDSDINMAFVIVQHLDPTHKSILRELIQRYTSMKVIEAKEGMRVEINSVYIIPPNYDMTFSYGALHLVKLPHVRGLHLPIDTFFYSLAKYKQNHSIGIILSGTGYDGTQGIKAIKEAGGIAMAQSVESAEFDGMPSSAIATGILDATLAPSEMPDRLMKYVNKKLKTKALDNLVAYDEETLKKIFILLQSQTSHDFSMYKPNTIGRRIERRLAVNKIDKIEEYYKYLQKSKDEIQALFKDLLIGVTSFFRDEDVFLYLEKNVISKLFSNKPSGATVRVWIPACSSGEEAYSIAILMMEYMQKSKENFTVQIFATDIDATAIDTARAGIYPLSISQNISEARLKKFFVKNSNINGYQIHKKIRDMLVFSVHNVIKDPPFSKLDFISCRNLMIYMNIELQQKIISFFHYALNSDGVLLIGNSESLGEMTNLYSVLDSKTKFFQCKKDVESVRQGMLSRFSPLTTTQVYQKPQDNPKLRKNPKLPLRELTENEILKQIAPAAVLVNERGDILYIHGRAGSYLELASGETQTNNVLTMARDGLRDELILAFHKVKNNNQVVNVHGLKVQSNNYFTTVDITLRAVTRSINFDLDAKLYLVLFQEDLYATKEVVEEISSSSESLYIQSLKQELQLQKEFLQDVNEKLETTNEELKSYNEEIQSMNEELQSTNEELETSKEELQSVNEELSTVNSELNTKVMDLSNSNNDMNNLLAGTGIGTIFVDFKLNILRFTPAVSRIINLIISDIGRPVGHIVSNMVNYNSLVCDVQSVLDTLIPKEIEVMTHDSKSYLMRIQPYRTLENVIEGAVISFVDITEMQTIREELNQAKELSRLAIVVRDSYDAVTVEDLSGKIIAWNPGATRLYGWSEAEALEMNTKDRIPKELLKKDMQRASELSNLEPLQAYKTKRLKKDGSSVAINIIYSALVDENEKIYAIATTERPQVI